MSNSATTKLISTIMESYGLNQGELAAKAGVSRSVVNQFLSGRTGIGLKEYDGIALVDRIAFALGIPPEALVRAISEDLVNRRRAAITKLADVRAAKSLDEAAQKRRGTKAQDGMGYYPQTHRDQRKHFRPTPADEGKRAGSAVKRPA